MPINFDALVAEVSRNQTVDSSAMALITGVVTKLEEIKLADAGEQAQLDALTSELRGHTDALAAAVSANTPQEPTEPTEPPVEPPVTPEA